MSGVSRSGHGSSLTSSRVRTGNGGAEVRGDGSGIVQALIPVRPRSGFVRREPESAGREAAQTSTHVDWMPSNVTMLSSGPVMANETWYPCAAGSVLPSML